MKQLLFDHSKSFVKSVLVKPVLIAIILISASCHTQNKVSPYINPFIGTGGHGHTYPGAQVPFGMVQLSPDTRNDGSWDGCSGYHYSDSSIIGFSHTHLSGTGVSDYGDILLMPITGNLTLNSGTSQKPDLGYRSRFSHDNETASPGYYAVYLDDYKVLAELTSSERVGFHRYTFDRDGEVNLLLDLIHRDPVINSEIQIISNNRLVGYRRSKYWAGDQQVFFAIQFSKPFKETKLFNKQIALQNTQLAKGKNLQASSIFATKEGEQLEVQVALSTVSIEGALKNLHHETKNIDFDGALKNAQTTWENKLGKVEVEGGSTKENVIFYTALYHSLLSPNISQDIDGHYRGMDGEVHKAEGFTNYTVFSLWDTFRALHPLLSLIEPQRTGDFAKCLVQKSKEFGELPMWELASNDTRCMIGYHAVSLIADAQSKGLYKHDLEEAYIEMVKTAMMDKRGLKAYKTLGFVPANKSSQSVSKTLEYAYNDWCIAQVAKTLGHKNDYQYFMNRSCNYQNNFDSSTGFMRGKNDDHTWVENFDPTAVGYNYTEGNAYQYSLFVPHDVNGMVDLLGGRDSLDSWLDQLVTTKMKHELGEDTDVSGLIGQYAHGNEPSHHMAYWYNYAGKPWKTQAIVREIMRTQYNDTPSGICGNEDCGQMSAWYVLSAIGLYSDCPGEPSYSIGSPIFKKVTLHLKNDKKFTIEAPNNTPETEFIESASLNNKELKEANIQHIDITNGGVLQLIMNKEPKAQWATNTTIKRAFKNSPIAYLRNSSDVFIDTLTIDIKCDDPKANIHYTLDGTEPTLKSNKFISQFCIKKSSTLKFRSYKSGCEDGYIVTRQLKKLQSASNINTSELQQGLKYTYYEGIYRSVYDFVEDKAIKEGIVYTPTLDVRSRNEWIGLDFDGFIKIPTTGHYTFFMDANDGCQIIIDDEELFESDGRKTDSFAQENTIALSKGFHKINMKFYQCSDDINLTVKWKGFSFDKQTIPASAFYHTKVSK